MRTIQVELFDAASQKQIAHADLPPDQLPETFERSTTIHLGDGDWHVEHAEPTTRAAYVASGRLRLVIRKIEYVDPKKILYSLPTLETALPPLREGDASAAHVMHEDDWRQIELVSSRLEPEIAVELAAIRAVHDERKGVGFERLHVRERIAAPLADAQIGLAELRAAIGGEAARREVAFGGGGGVVVGGFAFAVDEGAVYGREDGDRVVCIGLTPGADPALLAPLAKAHALVIVDWCAARVVG